MITFQQVTKVFNKEAAVRDVSFHIKKGEVVALLGPNGAGKSTIIQLLLGLRKPTSGTIRIVGETAGSLAVCRKTGVMLQEVSLLDMVTVRELLGLVRGYFREPLPLGDQMRLAGIESELLPLRTEKLSGGQKRRVNFALALAGDPELLVLDEPTVGMDAPTRRTFWKTVTQLAERGTTVLFTTHYIEEAEQAASRILLVKEGQLTHDTSPQNLKRQVSLQRITFRKTESLNATVLQKLPGVSILTIGDYVTLETEEEDRLLKQLVKLDVDLQELTVSRSTLEEAYTALTNDRKVL